MTIAKNIVIVTRLAEARHDDEGFEYSRFEPSISVPCRAHHFSDLAATGAPGRQVGRSFAMLQQDRPIANNSAAVRMRLKAFGYNFAIDRRLLQSQVSGAAVGDSRFLARLDSFLSITQTGSMTRQHEQINSEFE